MDEISLIGTLIPGFPGYTITRSGVVRSYRRRGRFGGFTNIPRIKKSRLGDTGYLVVGLTPEGKKPRACKVHRLLAETFLPNPTNLPCVLHGDDIKLHNDLPNLRWGTKSENGKDEYLNTQVRKQKISKGAKYTKDIVLEIRRRYAEGLVTQKELAQEYGMHRNNVYYIIKRKIWAWLK